jgi:hypothetical protein
MRAMFNVTTNVLGLVQHKAKSKKCRQKTPTGKQNTSLVIFGSSEDPEWILTN